MSFWKKHLTLRAVLMILFFVAGLVLVLIGWKMTGKLEGLALMLVGIVLMLTTLLLYNKRFSG